MAASRRDTVDRVCETHGTTQPSGGAAHEGGMHSRGSNSGACMAAQRRDRHRRIVEGSTAGGTRFAVFASSGSGSSSSSSARAAL
ncbi:MAG: hypothetical protein WDW36_003144 [Sanguina aurantia]